MEDAQTMVNVAIDGYSLALVKLGTTVGLRLLTNVGRIEGKIDNISDQLRQISLLDNLSGQTGSKLIMSLLIL
jgi:hypothetical protein